LAGLSAGDNLYGNTTTAGSATQLVVTGQPPSIANAGSTFGVVVSAENAAGGVDPNFQGSVTLTLGSNPGSSTLAGTTTVIAVNGVAVFTNLQLDRAGTGYVLQAISNGLTAGTTAAFSVTGGAATHLVVSVPPPGSVSTASNFGLSVAAEDALGNVDPGFHGNVTIALSSDPGGAALGGLLTTAAVNGIATFSGLTLDRAGSGYVLQANAVGLTSASTLAFAVTPPAPSPVPAPTPPPPTPALSGNASGEAAATLVLNVTSKTSRATRGIRATLTVRNLGAQPLQGPLYVVLRGLRSTAKLRGAAGFVGGKKKSPFVTLTPIGGALQPGDSLSLGLQFSGKPNAVTLSVFAGTAPQ
jgi:hypothetical protein